MTKRILLVDDEEYLLKSLQEGLEPLSQTFKTDICFSVDDAIRQVVIRKYDLIITDIRMPGKSGIDLIMYLRDVRYSGRLMVMSAYNTEENIRQINYLGVVDVISKPFNFSWFKRKLQDIFSGDSKEKQRIVTFESIDLMAVMQILNLEAKTATLEVDLPVGMGKIFFDYGDIVQCTFMDLEGEDALMELLARDEGSIAVKNVLGKVRRTISTPFVELMIRQMKAIDEYRREQAGKSNSR